MPVISGFLDDVGRVQPTAETHLQNARVRSRAGEGQYCHGRRDLEKARFDALADVQNLGEELRQMLVVDQAS